MIEGLLDGKHMTMCLAGKNKDGNHVDYMIAAKKDGQAKLIIQTLVADGTCSLECIDVRILCCDYNTLKATAKSLCNHEGNEDCTSIVEKHYENNIVDLHIEARVLGNYNKEDVLKWIALYSRKFYLDFFGNEVKI